MFIYDNTENKRKTNSLTVSFFVDGEEVLYTYIRKNACTSFKNLIASYSPHDFKKAGSRLKGMASYHMIKSPAEAGKVKNRVFIYRDPVERVVSVFKNKFIQQSGAKDIIKNFSKITGLDVEKCTFNDFVEEYVAKISQGIPIDAHLLPQQWHLLPIVYNRAIDLKAVREGMAEIVGDEVSKQFFSRPLNSTGQKTSSVSCYCGDWKLKELRNLYDAENSFPPTEFFYVTK